MAGFDTPYVPGWDCHGLPIKLKVDNRLGSRKAKMTAAEIRAAESSIHYHSKKHQKCAQIFEQTHL
jgi:isoleucyl-tRNA synthetase